MGGAAEAEAAKAGLMRILRMLLDRGADLNSAGATGLTALHHAARNNRPAVIKELLASHVTASCSVPCHAVRATPPVVAVLRVEAEVCGGWGVGGS